MKFNALTRTAASIIPLEDEVATSAVAERACLQVFQLGEDELQCAVGIRTAGRNIKAEDGADVVGGENTVVLVTEGLVGL